MLRPKQDGVAEEAGEAFRLLASWLERRVAAQGGVRDVDDVVQEAFVRFGRYPAGATRRPRALLLRIASNLTVDAARRRSARGGDRMEGPEVLRDLVDPSPDPAFLIDLKRAVLELPPTLRETFLLARFTPMTNAEVAAHLGISTKTVEWRISRAVSICLARLDR